MLFFYVISFPLHSFLSLTISICIVRVTCACIIVSLTIPRTQGEVMWPRLVANKILKKRLGGNNFVADFPSNSIEALLDIPRATRTTLDHKKQTLSYKVFVGTWNFGGVVPPDDLEMEDWLDTPNNHCDIYVLGFQEVVPLSASNVLGSENCKISMKWSSLIRRALNKKSSPALPPHHHHHLFRCIISKQMVGILISVWVRGDLLPYISHPSVSCVGCGIMGCLGNKGAVSVRFQLCETSFCFVCTHLASGGREGDEKHRNSDVAEILSRTIFPGGLSHELPRKILDHERVVLLGDLNYRISLPEATTRILVDRKEWDVLLENDQLRMELLNGQVFYGWHEGTIKFAPTYKYCLNSNEYFGRLEGKKGGKSRAPAWCDRIIWHGSGLKQHFYSRGESNLSDHRPVKAIFCAEVESLSRNRKGFQNFFLSERFDDDHTNKFEMSSSTEFLRKSRPGFKM